MAFSCGLASEPSGTVSTDRRRGEGRRHWFQAVWALALPLVNISGVERGEPATWATAGLPCHFAQACALKKAEGKVERHTLAP